VHSAFPAWNQISVLKLQRLRHDVLSTAGYFQRHIPVRQVFQYCGFHYWDTTISAEFAGHVFLTKELVFVISIYNDVDKAFKTWRTQFFLGACYNPWHGELKFAFPQTGTVPSALPVFMSVYASKSQHFATLIATVSISCFSRCLAGGMR
jgi:hypothetical protein